MLNFYVGHIVQLKMARRPVCVQIVHFPSFFYVRNAFKKILCRFLCNKAEPRQPGALVRMGLVPFAPHTVAIGLADRFPPNAASAANVVTAASEGSQVDTSSIGFCDTIGTGEKLHSKKINTLRRSISLVD